MLRDGFAVSCRRGHQLALNFMLFFFSFSLALTAVCASSIPIHHQCVSIYYYETRPHINHARRSESVIHIIYVLFRRNYIKSQWQSIKNYFLQHNTNPYTLLDVVHYPLPVSVCSAYKCLTWKMDIWKSVYIRCYPTLPHSITMWTNRERSRKTRTLKSYQTCFFQDMIIKRFVKQDTHYQLGFDYGPTDTQIETNSEKGSK